MPPSVSLLNVSSVPAVIFPDYKIFSSSPQSSHAFGFLSWLPVFSKFGALCFGGGWKDRGSMREERGVGDADKGAKARSFGKQITNSASVLLRLSVRDKQQIILPLPHFKHCYNPVNVLMYSLLNVFLYKL